METQDRQDLRDTMDRKKELEYLSEVENERNRIATQIETLKRQVYQLTTKKMELDKEWREGILSVQATQCKPVEVSRDLIGRFVVDLSWVPCRSTVDNVFSKELRYLWCVKSLVILRDKGVCRVCGDKVRGNTWKVLKLVEEDGWKTTNCFLVCSQCALCRGSKFFDGEGVVKMKALKRFILRRRRSGYGGSKKLSMYGMSVLKALSEEKEVIGGVRVSRKVVEKLVNMPRR